ncbi:MAG: 1-acyl-sn-glycerol-3-phosphate acyltransferase [Desulfuromonadales bacterium]|nr:1-acyl-sn-glycerol-3-phosphate acyltransferase [Desulfuromonadales bacterium]
MLRTLFFYLVFYPWTVIALSIGVCLSLFGQNVVHRWGILWGRSCLWLAGLKLKVTGSENLTGDGPAIYVSNHQSNFDIPLLYAGLPIQFRWMAKQELFNIPLFGLAMKSSGYIPIDRSNRKEAMRSLTAAARRIRAGVSVIIFPEGTRSADGTLQPFKKGALLLAAKAGVPIVPMAIHGSHQVQPKGSLRINPTPLQLTIMSPIATDGLKMSHIDQLTDQVHDQIAHCLENHEQSN